MTGLVITLVILAVLLVGAAGAKSALERRRKAEADAETLGLVRGAAEEDVTRLGEELSDLHVETLTDTLDTAMRQDYQRALDSYESAKLLLRDVARPEDVKPVTEAVEDGRYAMACVLARRDGRPVPERRPPCFFNPAHGPAQTDVEWSPPGGVKRDVPVCLADADRIEHGAEPDVRKLRDGNRMVPWYDAGPAYGAYAGGYWSPYVMSGLFPAFLLGSMVSTWDSPGDPGSGEGDYDFGGSSDGSSGGSSDGGGYDGGDGGGYDGGYDGGGSDGGGYDGGGFGGDSGGWGGGGDFGGGGGGDFGGGF